MRARALTRTVVLAAYVVTIGACADRPSKHWDWERMRAQPRYEPYGASAYFANGMAMRAPPSGTVPRQAEAAGNDSLAVTTPSAAMLARGATRFHVFCAVCHGERGDGASVVARNMDDPKPPSLLTLRARAFPPEQVAAIITLGVGRMPSYAAELSASDRWAVVAYLRDLQRHASNAPADSAPSSPR
ncbi:MAG TPA: cytochrome c [Gemmatimonadaceae bacterium]|nr:cytochrome c [Gemmatimonadaceae bacterium]